MCLYPKLIQNPKYKKNKKNGGIIPTVADNRITMVPVGCGNCIECRRQYARQWQVRLQEDIKVNTNGLFITLTFSNENYSKIYNTISEKALANTIQPPTGYNMDNEIATWALRHFLERWRKEFTKSLRHWLITEIGHNGTENIHLHGIIWTKETIDTIKDIWQYGYIWPRTQKERLRTYVNNKTINYITKYVTKRDEKHTTYKAKILTSSGIGSNYTTTGMHGDYNKNKYKGNQTNETYRTRQGIKLNLPVYYRNKIYTEQEREKLWIQKIEKQERWVLGNKISIKYGEQEYENALIEAQKINKRLGYGGPITWEQKEYENQRKELKIKERIGRTRE